MKASSGAQLVILKKRIKALERKLQTSELMAEAALGLQNRSAEIASEIFRAFAQQNLIKPRFANWYATQIRRGVRYTSLDGVMSPEEQEQLEEFSAMFTQQHYEALAKILRETRIEISNGTNSHSVEQIHDKHVGINMLQMKLQDMLKKDNPKFKELLFIGDASEHAPPKAKR